MSWSAGPGLSGAAGMHKPQQQSAAFTLLLPGLASVISKSRAQTCTEGAWTDVCPLNCRTESVSNPVSLCGTTPDPLDGDRHRDNPSHQHISHTRPGINFPHPTFGGANRKSQRCASLPRGVWGGSPAAAPQSHSLVQPEGPRRVQRQLGGAQRHLPGRAGRGGDKGRCQEGAGGTGAGMRDRETGTR